LDPEAILAAREMISAYPDYFRIDEVYFTAARSAFQLEKFDESIKFAQVIPEKHPTSAQRERALLLMGVCFAHIGNYSASAEALLQVLAGSADPAVKIEATETLRRLVRDHLTPGDLENLAAKYPGSGFAEELSLKMAKQEYARGNYAESYQLLTELLYHFPESKYTVEARRLLKLSAEAKERDAVPLRHIDPYKIGAIFPITGAQSVYGRYFEQGISLALEEYNQTHEFPVSVARADTRGNPIDAANAVRKLTLEEGVVTIVGSIFTVPTIAASVEANARGVSLLSPFVSSGRIKEIGPWIFQTKVPDEVEVTAIATAAGTGLLIERFAVLAPGFGERQRLGDFFGQEIERLGGQLVALEYYEEGETNFRQQLEAILEEAPQALFIPGTTDELIMILPQINFYDMQVQLLGMSNWNSDKLIRLARNEIEKALFPLAAYHGKDRETFDRFSETYLERFGGEMSSVAVAGYFGTRLLLRGLEAGVADRGQMRDFLYSELAQSADYRMAEAATLSIMTVRSGRVLEFRVPTHSEQ
jgi:branched-chain amino acid transport system substrate-binding protein